MKTFFNKNKYALFFVVGCSLLFLAVSGYRPYPSVDDFAYIPCLLKTIDPTLFKGDLAIEGTYTHYQHLYLLGKLPFFALSLPWLNLILTILLAVATGWIAFLLLRRLGGSGNLLPLLLYGTAGTILIGIGRGTFDGLFGHGFHPQWMGLVLVLLSYLYLLNGKDKWCGLALGVAIYVQVVDAVHAFIVISSALAFESIFQRKIFWRRYVKIFGLAILIGLPRFIMLLSHFFSQTTSISSSLSANIFRDIFVFRYPHEFTEFLSWKGYLTGLWLLLIVIAAIITSYSQWKKDIPVLAGLLIGHTSLLGCYLIAGWVLTSFLPWWVHLFHFSRTTPLFIFLLNLLVVAAIEGALPRLKGSGLNYRVFETDSSKRLMGLTLLVSYGFWCLISGTVSRWFLILPLTLFFFPLIRDGMAIKFIHKVFVGILLVFALTGIAVQPRESPLEEAERQLFQWCQTNTDQDSVFIVPPAFYQFRIFAKRPVYCSFRPIFLYYPDMAYELKARLIQTCNPDRGALEKGWHASSQWERCYIRRNPPGRIVHLLTETKSSYWLQDRKALAIPPFYPSVLAGNVDSLRVVFNNERFTVYAFKEGQHQ